MGDILVLLGPAGGDQPGLVEVDGDQGMTPFPDLSRPLEKGGSMA
jgi:hypothetical protein